MSYRPSGSSVTNDLAGVVSIVHTDAENHPAALLPAVQRSPRFFSRSGCRHSWRGRKPAALVYAAGRRDRQPGCPRRNPARHRLALPRLLGPGPQLRGDDLPLLLATLPILGATAEGGALVAVGRLVAGRRPWRSSSQYTAGFVILARSSGCSGSSRPAAANGPALRFWPTCCSCPGSPGFRPISIHRPPTSCHRPCGRRLPPSGKRSSSSSSTGSRPAPDLLPPPAGHDGRHGRGGVGWSLRPGAWLVAD